MSDTTVEVQHWLDRIKAGQPDACDQLIQRTVDRLQCSVARILARFPGVRRFERDSDVLQNALLRIRANLSRLRGRQETPATPRAFFALSACWIRDEIVTLLRHYYGPHGAGTHVAGGASALLEDAADHGADPHELSRWTHLHEAIDRLAPDARELFGLMWYHGLTLRDAARTLQMPERTAKRRWREVRLDLYQELGEDFLE